MNSIKIKVLLVYLLSFLLLSACSEKVETEYVDAQKAAKLLSKYLDDPINEVKREGIVVTEIGIDEENNVLEVGFFELS
ncbi:hypothetical protein MKY41_12040 [Sporosarcina sp. FSL W7-1349]|uniref:hypothetical protein n=1 Tax=Sporosarcina sp. FSL W7-1349 TaxID=2921561 RepID=UPI0030F618E0